MTNQDRTGVEFLNRDELSFLPLSGRPTANSDSEEILKLMTENVRLQHLVAELLIENQHLRQRHCGPRKDGEGAGTVCAQAHHPRDN